MEINSRYSIRTIDKHTPSECKSAMQKYARRGNGAKMYYAVQQLNSLVRFDKDREKVLSTIKAVRTNMINRLSVILFEDVSFKSVFTFENVITLIKTWKSCRTDSVQCDDGSILLKKICEHISSAKKARQPSFLRNYYGHRTSKASKIEYERMMTSETTQYPSFGSAFSWVYQNESEAYDWLLNHNFRSSRINPLIVYALAEWKRLKKSSRISDRLLFLVVPMLWIKYGWDDSPTIVTDIIEISKLDRFDDYVYDMHTGEGSKTRLDFVTDGSYVTNEDDTAIDVIMKKMYREQVSPARCIRIPVFTDVIMIVDGLCGAKLPCFHAVFKGEKKIVKPFTKSLNFGLDYAYVDAQKKRFGIPELNIKLVEIPGLAVAKLKTGFSLVWNHHKRQVFAVMDEIKHKNDLGKNKYLLNDETKYDEMLKIRLVNGLFRTSDNILRNILVRASDDALIPIDENDILGKRETIFNASEPIKRNKFWAIGRLLRIVRELNLKNIKYDVLNDLEMYGIGEKRRELSDRIDKYEEIVETELKVIGLG